VRSQNANLRKFATFFAEICERKKEEDSSQLQLAVGSWQMLAGVRNKKIKESSQ
jgi:hypothetical protein